MSYLPDTNACIAFLRQRNPLFIARWQSVQPSDISLCSIVIYELRYGAQRSVDSAREHAKLERFLAPYTSCPFDDDCAVIAANIRHELERQGNMIGPHDLQIAAIALRHGFTLLTHNTQEFSRVSGLQLDDWEV